MEESKMNTPATDFFTSKRNQFQKAIEEASTAQTKINTANQALGILGKPTITAAEAQTLIENFQALSTE